MPNSIAATDEIYNAPSRSIELKLDLYLYGKLRPPVTLSKDNYLIDVNLLEETNSEDKTPFGNVTANEISIQVMNKDGVFSPTNTSSPYYGYMKRGVEVKMFIRPMSDSGVDYNWDELGVFYVTDWEATITSLTASITAADKLYSVFELPDVKVPVVRNLSFIEFYRYIFSALGLSADIDESLTSVLVMAYTKEATKELLTDVSIGALANCFCGHDGNIKVKSIISPRSLRATLTDGDQIIDVDASQSSDTSYTGASVTCHIPTESAPGELLKVNDLNIPVGTHMHDTYALSKVPMIRLIYASLNGATDDMVIGIKSNSTEVTVTTLNNSDKPHTLPLSIVGTTIDTTDTVLADNSESDYTIDSTYIQSTQYAADFKKVLRRYIKSDTPVLELSIRGNPLLNLGDKIRVQSEKYNLDFTGIILRQELNYNGALSGKITLLSAAILEGT